MKTEAEKAKEELKEYCQSLRQAISTVKNARQLKDYMRRAGVNQTHTAKKIGISIVSWRIFFLKLKDTLIINKLEKIINEIEKNI